MQYLLETENLEKSYSGKKILHNISLRIPKGEIYGFLGKNGAGKTTTMKILTGLIMPDKGTITFNGNKVSFPISSQYKTKISFLPEVMSLYPQLTPVEILLYFGSLFSINKKELKEKLIPSLLERVQLTKHKDSPIKQFSKGMQQRLGIAQSLINNPDLLILDEPVSGLDPQGRKMIKDILVEEKKKGKSIIISSHLLFDISQICDRAGILYSGRMLVEDEVKNLIKDDQTLEDKFVEIIKKEEEKE